MKRAFTRSGLKIITYETTYAGQKFYIDIVEISRKHHEAWIYTRRMGVKDLMFGNGYLTEEKFTRLAIDNFEEYAKIYLKDHY